MKRLLFPLLLAAQTLTPTFDAASIKVNHSGGNGMGGTGITRTGAFSRRNVTLESLISESYSIATSYQLSGLPSWGTTVRYDVDAKPDHAVDYETAQSMLRNLLAERFQLQVHHEQAAVNGYKLTVDKGGAKLKASEEKGIGFRFQMAGKIQGPGDMRMLALTLRGILHAPVQNQTGLDGKYDIDLQWTPDELTSSNEPTVSVFAAIKEKLGLSLDPAKVTVDRLVIDRVERATEN